MRETLIELSDGNPGALTVLTDCAAQTPSSFGVIVDKLEEHDIRGSLIWVGYKDICDEELSAFISSVLREDDDFLEELDEYRNRLNESD